jgi:hypothetical protein
MAELTYLLCALTSLICAGLLVRTYQQSRTDLLLWSSICFAGLAVNNALLFVDLVLIGPETDLSLLRSAIALASLCALLFGLIWKVH